jgi:hypothetical protein
LLPIIKFACECPRHEMKTERISRLANESLASLDIANAHVQRVWQLIPPDIPDEKSQLWGGKKYRAYIQSMHKQERERDQQRQETSSTSITRDTTHPGVIVPQL